MRRVSPRKNYTKAYRITKYKGQTIVQINRLYKYRNGTFFTLFIIVLVLYGVKIITESKIAIDGIELARIEEERATLKSKTIQLENELLTLRSLQYIKREALREGFVDSTNTDYLFIK